MRCFILLSFLLLLVHTPSFTCSSVLPLCNHHDNSNLLHFKNSFAIKPSLHEDWRCSSYSNKTASWNNGTDCCEWDGVTCDTTSGHVIGLDLSCSMLKGELNSNSTLFHLTHLQQLNLAYNDLSTSPLSSRIGDLVALTHLDLSNSALGGDIPFTISHLSKLLSLDLSRTEMLDDMGYSKLRLDESTWSKLIGNTTNLEKLVLDGVDMSSIREIPDSIGHLKSLNQLQLFRCQIDGLIPVSLWNLTQLTILNLSGNRLHGEIPSLLSNLKHLTYLDLSFNTFSGHIPDVFHNFTKLDFLKLSSNNLGGQIPPSLFHLTQLSSLILSSNQLIGPISSKNATLSKLEILRLSNNFINGTILDWCYSLSSLTMLHLSMNQLTGPINKFFTYSLTSLFLSHNKFQGDFSNSIFEFLKNLSQLDMSFNYLSGLVDFSFFSKLENLFFLDLSNNKFLSIDSNSKVDYVLPQFMYLSFSFCSVTVFPSFLPRLQNLGWLDLSNNKIHEKIPNWFRDNLLYTWKMMKFMDLSFNQLQGDLPIPPSGTNYLLCLALKSHIGGNCFSRKA